MTRTSRASGLIGVLALGALGLAACGGGGTSYGSSGTTSSGATQSAAGSTGAAAAGGTALKTASTSLGTVVVDSSGRTVYFFDKDTANSGKSACSGGCAGLWPAVSASGTPAVTGVTAKVGTITRSDGTKQVTLDGHPIYTYSGDSKPGDVAGQGVMGIWWVVSPSGAEMSASPSSSSGY
ncbi:MAG: COG4315 family predicted lipoprotein [Blastococcus sp.]